MLLRPLLPLLLLLPACATTSTPERAAGSVARASVVDVLARDGFLHQSTERLADGSLALGFSHPRGVLSAFIYDVDPARRALPNEEKVSGELKSVVGAVEEATARGSYESMTLRGIKSGRATDGSGSVVSYALMELVVEGAPQFSMASLSESQNRFIKLRVTGEATTAFQATAIGRAVELHRTVDQHPSIVDELLAQHPAEAAAAPSTI